ncbi:hypothetical protein WJX77_008584 [Trebouxia sp. C0004]
MVGRTLGAEPWQGAAASEPTPAAAPSPAPVPASSTPPAVAELLVSATVSRKLVFDGVGIDKEGAVAALARVYLDGYLGFSPFIKYFPVPQCIPLPDEFMPEAKQAPEWEQKHRHQWDKRKDVAFEVCRQAYAVQQAVNAKVPVFERSRAEEARQSKKKFVARTVSMDLRTVASKIAGLLQDAIQANKKSGCYPQSLVSLSSVFKGLQASASDVMVHRNINGPKYEAASGHGRWLCIASSSDIDAMVAELYA